MSVSRETSVSLSVLLDRISGLGLVRGLLNQSDLRYSGLTTSFLSLVILALKRLAGNPLLCLSDDSFDNEDLFLTVLNLAGDGALYFPKPDSAEGVLPGFYQEWERYHQETVQALKPDFNRIVFSDLHTAHQPLIDENPQKAVQLSVGTELNLGDLLAALDSWGYDRVDHVHTPKTYAVRGGIADVFPLASSLPVRLELFGSEVESIRYFNPVSQRTTTTLSGIELPPPSGGGSGPKISLRASLPEKALTVYLSKDERGFSINTSAEPARSAFINCPTNVIGRQPNEVKQELLASAVETTGGNVFLFTENDEQTTVCKNKLNARVQYINCPLQLGFSLPESKLAVFTYAEIFRASAKIKRRWAPKLEKAGHQKISSLESINWGDLLVHRDFGIGHYRGLSLVDNRTFAQECIKIEYADNGVVYVPVDKFERVHKYIPAGDTLPTISRLGTAAWEKQKLQTRKSAAKVIEELVRLYAARNQPRGFTYQADNELLGELEASFPYDETPDQAVAITNTQSDFTRDKPMDRLICGDVGFGKTEVALRAAMYVISSGFKVAFLAPTTVLADQHYLTVKNRLEPLGVRVALLSRFRTPTRQKQILASTLDGAIDIIVGTHRLLSPDVEVPRLGLLIVDEEHRFGVRHKEKIKQLKRDVDVLTLTATPIPRTLQQSLIGVRDISKIETPPKERLPIRTSVSYFNWDKITAALQRELNRDGQAFFLHNNIENLPFYRDKLQQSFPNQSVAMAHGQMTSKVLERTMLDFYDAKIDILVCTTIIESGLDIANVNTVIINDAHRFGLAQTYQIRGRVGRSNRQAYCLLVIPKKLKITKNAYQRLKAIEYYSNLGSGYDIALKDLEIRGAGNLFGFEQSGQIAAIGFDLYCQILKEAVDEALERPSTPQIKPARIIFDGDALIPAEYMDVVQDRLLFYQRLGEVSDSAELKEIREEIRDRYGRIPPSVESLFYIAGLRIGSLGSGLMELRVEEAAVKGKIGNHNQFSDPLALMASLEKTLKQFNRPYRFGTSKQGNLTFELDTESLDQSMDCSTSIVQLFSPGSGD